MESVKFLKKIYKTFVGALEIVRDIEVSVLERFDCTCILKSFAVREQSLY